MSVVQPSRGSYLQPAFENATVSDVMRVGVLGCSPDATVVSVAQSMATHHVHSVVVAIDTVDGGELTWGIICDRDLVHAAATQALDATARDLARTEAATIEPSASLGDAALIMDRHRIAHLVVVDGRGPIGVVSTLDIIGAIAWGQA